MKKLIFVACLFGNFFIALGQSPQSAAIPQDEQPEYSELQLLETWGWLLAEQFNLGNLEITQGEVDAISRGIAKHVEGVQAPTDLRFSVGQMQVYFSEREKRVAQRQREYGRLAEQEFFDTIIGQPGIQGLATGLHFEILEPGNDERPTAKDNVRVHYKGTFLDGRVFDSSYDRNEPSEFKLTNVIPAWTQGLPLIGVGGKMKLYVPARLGYGDEGRSGIPPASALIFEIELLDILKDPPPAPSLPALNQP